MNEFNRRAKRAHDALTEIERASYEIHDIIRSLQKQVDETETHFSAIEEQVGDDVAVQLPGFREALVPALAVVHVN